MSAGTARAGRTQTANLKENRPLKSRPKGVPSPRQRGLKECWCAGGGGARVRGRYPRSLQSLYLFLQSLSLSRSSLSLSPSPASHSLSLALCLPLSHSTDSLADLRVPSPPTPAPAASGATGGGSAARATPAAHRDRNDSRRHRAGGPRRTRARRDLPAARGGAARPGPDSR